MSFLDNYIKKRSEKSPDFSTEYKNQGRILKKELQKNLNKK